MPSQVQRVLMAFRLIFVFETVVAELARVLLLHLMRPVGKKFSRRKKTQHKVCGREKNGRDEAGAYRNSSSLSNFFGFLGQHSHINWPPMRDALLGLV